jgi:hypothetical protein
LVYNESRWGGAISEETVVVNTVSGSSAKFVAGGKILYQVSSGLNEGDNYALSVWSYAEELNSNGLGLF